MPAFAAPSARGIESRLVRVVKKASTESSEKKCLAFNACVSRHPVVGENSVVMIYD
jgi:hypothetical protein